MNLKSSKPVQLPLATEEPGSLPACATHWGSCLTSTHHPPVDIVKLPVEDPFLGTVLSLERAIGWAVLVGLDQTDIRSNHSRAGVFPCELQCPDACARSDVQDVGRLPDGRKVELLVEDKIPPAVLKI